MNDRAPAERMEADLVRIEHYWQKLQRGGNAIPFSDDIDLAALPGTERNVLLIEVFYDPVRFRIDVAGTHLEDRRNGHLAGSFLDELRLHSTLDGLSQQCTRVLETRRPVYWKSAATAGLGESGYARLVLPLWGDGHINMLLAAVVLPQQSARSVIEA